MPAQTPDQLFQHLDKLGIPVATVEHEAVFTVEQAKQHRAGLTGVFIKNLFLRNKKGAMWLVVLLEDRRLDLKALGKRIGAGHVSFASHDRLRRTLGVEPGAVTPFALINDSEQQVRVVIDEAVFAGGSVHCHPLDNRMTTAIAPQDLRTFIASCGHTATTIDFDAPTG